MGALQLNLLYILYFAAAEPNVFLLFYDHSMQDKQEHAVVWRAYFWSRCHRRSYSHQVN